MIKLLTISTVLAVLCSVGNAQSNQQQAAEDAAQISAASQKYSTNEYRQLFQPYSFGTEFEEKVAGYREHLQSLESFESQELPEIENFVEEFESRYGSDQESIRQAFRSINDNGGSIPGDPAFAWSRLKEVIDAPRATRSKMADELNQLGSTGGQTAQGYERMTVEESYARAKVYLQLALAYQPDHSAAKQALSEIDGEEEVRLAADQEAIDNAKFPPHAKSFQGDANTMAKTAFEYLETRNIGLDGELLAVRIAGDWKPYDTLLDVTINWGLPIEAAYRSDDNPDIAQVISMNLISRDEDPEPPFQRFVITGDRLMRVENLPSTAGGSGSGFRLLRLPLALSLMALGFVAAGPWLGRKALVLSPFTEKVVPYAAVIGMITLAFGALSFLFSLFSPFQDLLPISGAILLGFVVGLDHFIKKSSASETQTPLADSDHGITETNDDHVESSREEKNDENTPQNALASVSDTANQAMNKARGFILENRASLEKLNRLHMPIGIACFAIGFLHLIAGGFWFI